MMIVLLGAVRPAQAEDASEAIRIEYTATGNCPTEASFVARVQSRTRRARIALRGEHARTFVVNVAAGAQPSGRVTVTSDTVSQGVREVTAETCDAAADALSLVVALAIDPRALLVAPQSQERTAGGAASPPVAPSPAPEGAPSDAALATNTRSSSAPEDAGAGIQPPATAKQEPNEAPKRPSDGPRAHHRFFAGGDFLLNAGVTPDSPLLAGAPYIGWESPTAAMLAPVVRASFLRQATGVLVAPGGAGASYTWTAGRADVCAAFSLAGAFRLSGCGRVEAGVLSAHGEHVANPATKVGAWLAAGPLARAEWVFLAPFMVDASIAPTFRITADRFYFSPGTTVYAVPVVGLDAELGVGFHFL